MIIPSRKPKLKPKHEDEADDGKTPKSTLREDTAAHGHLASARSRLRTAMTTTRSLLIRLAVAITRLRHAQTRHGEAISLCGG